MKAISYRRLFYFTLAAVTCVLMLKIVPARADLNEGLNSMLDSLRTDSGILYNSTPGGTFEGQKMNTLSGGSLFIRNRNVKPQLVAFKAPSVDAGCNGIDINLGSLSLIRDPDQIAQYLRNTASGMAGYSFGLAIEAACPMCSHWMSKLQKDINDFNNIVKNSCESAKLLVDKTGLKDYRDKRVDEERHKAAAAGGSDYNALKNKEHKSGAPALHAVGGDAALEAESINVVYSALKDQNTKSWVADTVGGDALYRTIMSYTGTIVYTFEDTSIPDFQFQTITKPPVITVRDLLDGNPAANIYKCDGPVGSVMVDKCLNPVVVVGETVAIEGMRTKVGKIFFGDPSTSSAGIISKIASRSDALDATEISFINKAPFPIYKMLKDVSTEPGVAANLAEFATDIIALELVTSYAREMQMMVIQTTAARGEPLDSEFIKTFQPLAEALDREYERLSTRRNAFVRLYDVHQTLTASIRAKVSNKISKNDSPTTKVK